MPDYKIPQMSGIPNHHAQKVICIARHEIALHHLGHIGDPRLKHIKHLSGLSLERHLNENADPGADRFRIKKRDVTRYDPGLLQRSDARKAWRRRKPHPGREVHIRETSAVLKLGEDPNIDIVKFHDLFQ